jgi:hypothetical protein
MEKFVPEVVPFEEPFSEALLFLGVVGLVYGFVLKLLGAV